MKNAYHIKSTSFLILLIFLSNFLWEISQMFLYENHTDGFADFIFVHIRASFGDVLIFAIIYASGVLVFRDKRWFLRKEKLVYFFTTLCGFIIALIVEKYALATGRWEYNNLMPIIPILKVGLSPILQMVLLPTIFSILMRKFWTEKI